MILEPREISLNEDLIAAMKLLLRASRICNVTISLQNDLKGVLARLADEIPVYIK